MDDYEYSLRVKVAIWLVVIVLSWGLVLMIIYLLYMFFAFVVWCVVALWETFISPRNAGMVKSQQKHSL